jgi:hypothetical protein
MAPILWDIIASCESKHIWHMTNETWVDGFGLVSIMACFIWTRRVGQWTSFDQGWRMNQECIGEKMLSKWEMTMETMYNECGMFSTLVCLYG